MVQPLETPKISCVKPEYPDLLWAECGEHLCVSADDAGELLVYLKAVARYFEECI